MSLWALTPPASFGEVRRIAREMMIEQHTDRQIANVVTFVDYRKFEVDSTIDFSPPKR